MVLGGERFGEVEKVTDFLWGEEAFNRVTAEVGQRGVVEVGLDQRALCEEDLLNRPEEAYLLGVVVVGLNVSLEAAMHHLMVIGDGIEGEQVAKESEEVVHA
jgi:chaperonin GroEL (HSP60 family)